MRNSDGIFNLEGNAKYKILTIDDESYIRQSIRTYLEDYGFNVIEAENGCQGLAMFESEHPDLVVLDLRMPQMDGLQVLKKIKEISSDIPLVVASGTGNISAVVDALHLGARDYILKPIEDMSVLYHSIQKCLKESQLKKENMRYQEQLEELVSQRTLELQESEHRYKAVFEYTGTAAIIIELNDMISMANSKFCEFACMDAKDIIGKKKWYDFVKTEDIKVMRNYIETKILLANQEDYTPMQYEISFLDNNKGEKFVYVSIGIIPGADRVVVSLLDVTEKKKAEQRWQGLENQLRKSQKMEAIGTLAGGIAHDLNNILSPVLGYADMILRSSDPATDVYRRSEKIQKAALRAADLVNQVLSFNRAGEETKRRVHLHPVSSEVLKLLKGSIPTTIRLKDHIDRNCGMVEADPTQIHQVIMNLCTNAYHAMEDIGGELTIGLKEVCLTLADTIGSPNLVNGEGLYLALEVTDTGCGMTNDIVERIFDPYFTTKEEGKGTGLGLATAYSIVKSCNGDIRVKTQLNKGTTFTILLPVVDPEKNNDCLDPDSPSYPVTSGQTLLVVDDDQDIVGMCQEGFESLGYTVRPFVSSLAALEFFKKNYDAVDLVVTDQTMPGKTGFELAQDMLVIKPGIPVILCSGYTGAISEAKIKKAGIKSFVMKPVTVEELSNQIQQFLK